MNSKSAEWSDNNIKLVITCFNTGKYGDSHVCIHSTLTPPHIKPRETKLLTVETYLLTNHIINTTNKHHTIQI